MSVFLVYVSASLLMPPVMQLVPLFTTLLSLIRPLPLAQDTLDSLAPLLASVFQHIPEPGLCPLAFKHFWQQTYIGWEGTYPEILKPALASLIGVEGPAFASGLAVESYDSVCSSFQHLFLRVLSIVLAAESISCGGFSG